MIIQDEKHLKDVEELTVLIEVAQRMGWYDYWFNYKKYLSIYKMVAKKMLRISGLLEHCSISMNYSINLRMRKELQNAIYVLQKSGCLKDMLK